MYFNNITKCIFKSVLKSRNSYDSVLFLSALKWPFISLILYTSTVFIYFLYTFKIWNWSSHSIHLSAYLHKGLDGKTEPFAMH